MRAWLGLMIVGAVLGLSAGRSPLAEEEPDEAAALAQVVKELRVEAAEIRGLPWKRDVASVMLARERIAPLFEAEMDLYIPRPKRAAITRALRHLGLMKPDQDPFDLMKRMMQAMAAGFYSPREKKLFVVKGYAGDAQRPIILHELVHALEDQHFDLLASSLPSMFDPDGTFALSCVVEGSAEHARELYQQRHPEVTALFMKSLADPEHGRRQMEIMRKVPAFLHVPTQLHYLHGPRFVARALRELEAGGYAATIAQLHADVPVSQEQILHSDRWFSSTRDYPQRVVWAGDLSKALGRDGRILLDQRMGELDLALYLDFFVGKNGGMVSFANMQHAIPACEPARRAAIGWDAGRQVFLERADGGLVSVMALAFDTPGDAEEASTVLLEALKLRHGPAWKPHRWTAFAPGIGSPLASRTLTFEGALGAGRILHRGTEIIIADGVPPERLEVLWRWVERTQFTRDVRDTWKH